MNILIIGGSGYVGSEVTKELVNRGHCVEVIDLFMFGEHIPNSVMPHAMNAWQINDAWFKDMDCVIFLAGVSNDPMAEHDPALNFKDNAGLPGYVAYLSQNAGVKRFIYASSCSVYGFVEGKFSVETDDPISTFPYGISKLTGEKACLQLADDKFNVIAFRKGTVCGKSERMRYDLIINTMVKTAKQEGVIRVHNPDLWRPILDIRDAVSAYALAVEKPFVESGAYNILSYNARVGDIGNKVQAVCKQNGIRAEMDVQHKEDFRSYVASNHKAFESLGFSAQYDIYDTARSVIDHISQDGINPDDDIYSNIKVFKAWHKKD